jgi:hypothetical protein
MLDALPELVLAEIVKHMDPWTLVQFSRASPAFASSTKEYVTDAERAIRKARRVRAEALEACHRIITRIYDQNVLRGWCERCGRETLVYSTMRDTEERAMYVCLDRFTRSCGSSFPDSGRSPGYPVRR